MRNLAKWTFACFLLTSIGVAVGAPVWIKEALTTGPTATLIIGGSTPDPGLLSDVVVIAERSGVDAAIESRAASGAGVFLGVTSKGTLAAPLGLGDDDAIVVMGGTGWGSDNLPDLDAAAVIEASVDGAPTPSYVPSKIQFFTKPAGGAAGTGPSKRLTIRGDGYVGVADSAALNGEKMGVLGGFRATTYLQSIGVATGALPACNAAQAGSFEYDTTLTCPKYCNGTAWSACLATGSQQTINAVYVNSATVAATTYGGGIIPAQSVLVSAIQYRTRAVGTVGSTNAVFRATDGASNCDCTFACNQATGNHRAACAPTAGSCTFAASASITYSINSIGDCVVGPDLQGNILVEGVWK